MLLNFSAVNLYKSYPETPYLLLSQEIPKRLCSLEYYSLKVPAEDKVIRIGAAWFGVVSSLLGPKSKLLQTCVDSLETPVAEWCW